MTSLPTVLLFTYPEHGQANVNLATAYELALAGVNVHIGSFPSLRTRVLRLQELIDRRSLRSVYKLTGTLTFHEIKGVTPNWDAQAKCGVNDANLSHPPGVTGALAGYSKVGAALFFWDREEYLAAIESVKEIIAIIKPDVVGVDALFFAARDACRLANQKLVIISPVGLKEVAVNAQPYWAEYWKYPVLGSGFSFPLKWWQIPLNIYLHIRMILQSVASVNTRQTHALRSSLGLSPLFSARSAATCICPALPEIDYHFAFIPEEVVPCGPIIMPFDPLEESDPALMKWLDNGPTVLVNLGSHMVSNATIAREMASAFRILLDYHDKIVGSRRIQVLWKARPDENIQAVVDEIVGKEIEGGQVKVVAWLDVEPVSVLQHHNMVCTVHHGGANSFYEGVWSGVPHIVLPVWFDTYDYARRAEYLNIGIFGNKTSAPGVRADEFGQALVTVTRNSQEADKLRTSARHLKEVCQAKGNGRELASMVVLGEAGIMKREHCA